MDAPNLTDVTVCISLTTGHPGQRRKLAPSDVTRDGVPTEPLHVSKSVLDCAELKAVIRRECDSREWLRSRALPSPLKQGIYLLPVTLVERVDAKLAEDRAEWESLIEAFFKKLPTIIEADREKLGELFDPRDYPNPARLRNTFVWETRYLSFSTPGKLKEINAALFKREADKAAADLKSAVEDIKALLRVEMKGLVDHMLDRLTPDTDGKRKVFRDTLVGNLSDFLGVVDLRNVTGDSELQALAAKAKALLDGVDAQLLRDEEGVREAVAGGFVNIKAELDKLVTNAPTRKIVFEE